MQIHKKVDTQWNMFTKYPNKINVLLITKKEKVLLIVYGVVVILPLDLGILKKKEAIS